MGEVDDVREVRDIGVERGNVVLVEEGGDRLDGKVRSGRG